MSEHIQRNARGEPVLPNPLRDMVHTMRAIEHVRATRPSPYYPRFTAIGCWVAGTHHEDEAERVLAELEALGYVEQIAEHDPGSFRTTAAGRVWLDEQLAAFGIPAFDSDAYRNANTAERDKALTGKGKRDFPEDAVHENGQYCCFCVSCGHQFVGLKRRIVCKLCTTPSKNATAATEAP